MSYRKKIPNGELCLASEAAELLGVAKSYIPALRDLPCTTTAKGVRIFWVEDVLEYKRRREAGETEVKARRK